MATLPEDTKEFGARIPESEYERFRKAFPQYGASTWFINTSIREFNEQVAANPSSIELINASIVKMLQDNRERGEDTVE